MQNLSLKCELYNHSKIFVFLNCMQFDPTLFLFPLIYNDRLQFCKKKFFTIKKNQLYFISKHMQKKIDNKICGFLNILKRY